MNLKLVSCLTSMLLIRFVGCVHNFSSHFHIISSQTNCSFNDLKCINNRNIISNISSTLSDNKNSTLDSYWKLCVAGETYFNVSRKECTKCLVECPHNSKVHKKCNGTQDTQCVCNSGYFMAVDLTCKPCSQCESGWGIWRSCRGSRNTVCRKCPPGTFSGVQTGTLGCILCTKCDSNSVTLEECSGVHDSICFDKQQLKSTSNYTKEDYFPEDEGKALPICFTILIVIVLVFISYVIIQLRVKRMVKSQPNCNYKKSLKPPVHYLNLYNKEVNQLKQNNFNQFVKTDKISNNYEESKHFLIVKRYNELNTSVRRAFEIKLNNDSKSWKSLAIELGYTIASISSFESLGRQHMNCVQYFLSDWSQYKDATINSLLKALLRIGRIDCVQIIDPSFRFSPY